MGTQRSTATAMALALLLVAANGLAADGASTDGADAYQDGWGPAVGDPVPPIAAEDQGGDVRDLASLSGGQGLVLIVSRSAVW